MLKRLIIMGLGLGALSSVFACECQIVDNKMGLIKGFASSSGSSIVHEDFIDNKAVLIKGFAVNEDSKSIAKNDADKTIALFGKN